MKLLRKEFPAPMARFGRSGAFEGFLRKWFQGVQESFRAGSGGFAQFRLLGWGKLGFLYWLCGVRAPTAHIRLPPQSRLSMWHSLSSRLETNSETYSLPDQKREIRAPGPTFQAVIIAAFI
jgi:hypothetical protein